MINPSQKWTLELCQDIASKYTNKKDFYTNSSTAYVAAHKYKWIDTICKHMKVLGNRHKRCIYVYEFPDNSAYIGLTYNFKHRHETRNSCKRDTVTNYINKTELHPVHIQLTDYIPVHDAIEKEAYFVNQYRNQGWNVLNKAKTGSIGNCVDIVYTNEQEQQIIDLYNNGFGITEVSKKLLFNSSRRTIRKILIKNKINLHLPELIWDYDKCKAEASKYNNKKDFIKFSKPAYQSAYLRNWLDDICKHMIETEQTLGYWNNYDRCKLESQKYCKRRDFARNSVTAYKYSRLNNWLLDFFPVIDENSKGYWNNKENCRNASATCECVLLFK